MTNILVTGSNGQLGSEILEISSQYDNYKFQFTDISTLDITDYLAVDKFVKKYNIKVIINCAAYTAVEKAESEPEIADLINHLAVANFAKVSKKYKIKLIHISTDYVFDGKRTESYSEDCITNPESVYGKTKLDGELAIQKTNPKNSVIIRTSWLYSGFGNNFVKTMLELSKQKSEIDIVSDQIGTPTYARDLAVFIIENIPKITNEKTEIFHFSNGGKCSWYDFAKAIFEITKKKVKLNPVDSSEYSTVANRPNFSVLNKTKIKNEFKIQIPHWRNSLKKYFNAQ